MNIRERFPNTISQYRVERVSALVHVPTAFEFADRAGVKGWFARMAWRLLQRGGFLRDYMQPVERVTYGNLQSREVKSAILEAIENAHRDIREPHEIIMGRDIFQEIVGDKDLRDAFTFTAGPFKHGAGHELYGVPVKVIPWVKGWAVL